MTPWRDLSNDELAQRLRLRGLPQREVVRLVEGRESEEGIAWIAHHLEARS